MKELFSRYGGILMGALYGLLVRVIFGWTDFGDVFSLLSITFLGVVPIILGLIPIFLASDEQLEKQWYPVVHPLLTVLVFFIFCIASKLEDLLCIIVLAIPYMAAAVVFGIIARTIIVAKRKKRNKKLYSILLLPVLLGPIEQQFNSPVGIYSVVSTITVDARPEEIWPNIIRVREIKEEEYKRGFFNIAGIPRPLYAELDKDTLHATRIGHFEGGLMFIEKVDAWDRYNHIGFNIKVVPSTIRKTVFDQHLLKGDHFRFLNAAYTLKPMPNGRTELILSSTYQLKTKINPYAAFWGEQLLSDFQERLLKVIKKRCEP
ncbi:MAG: hypothetical protein J7578_00270 [Chitinophagaceae bacterium]|nr:hypothetical protein [Chitinophagaceae bacterium]